MVTILKKMTLKDWTDWLGILMLISAGTLMLAPVYHWIWLRWTEYESYYSHGPLVILISVFIIFKELKKISKQKNITITLGYRFNEIKTLLLLLGIGLYLLGCLMKVYFLIGLSVWLIFVTIISAVVPKNIFNKIKFGLYFLLLALPLPMVLSEQLALFLKILSAKVAAKLLTLIGIITKVYGNVLYTPYSTLEVGAPCSGLRSIISLFAMAILFSYLNKISYKRALILIAFSPIVAFAGNILRIFSLGFVADIYGQKVALGTFHTVIGYLIFGIDLLALFGIAKLLGISRQ